MDGKSTTLLQKFQTGLIVTLISVLVWLYAEGEAVTERAEQFQLQFVPPVGAQLAIDPEEPVQVRATFRASTGQMDQVKQLIERGPIQIVINEGMDDGPIVLADALANSPLGALGVNVERVLPSTLMIHAEPLETVTLPVAVVAGATQMTPPTTETLQAQVTLPASLAHEARGQKVIAPLNEVDLSQFEVNVPHTMEVPLRLPAQLQRMDLDPSWVRIEPRTVQVKFTIQKQTDTVTLTSVPIHLNVPPLLIEQFSIELNDDQMVVRDLVLSGPSDVINRIRQREVRVWAELRPSIDELESGVESLPLHLNAPPSVTLQSPLPRVPVQVTRRG